MIKPTFYLLCSVFLPLLLLSSCITLYYGWGNKTLQSTGGTLVVLDDTEIPFFQVTNGQPVISATLISGSCRQDLYFIIDTGYRGSCIDTAVLAYFPDSILSKYKFYEVISSGNIALEGKGYDFSQLSLGSAIVENPLFACYDLSRAGINLNLGEGRRLSGIIGMNILKQHSFIISNSHKTLSFVKAKPKWENSSVYTLNNAKKSPFQIEVIADVKNEPFKFILDTGAGTSIISENLFSKYVDTTNPKKSESSKADSGRKPAASFPS